MSIADQARTEAEKRRQSDAVLQLLSEYQAEKEGWR